ncbi:hypothetical protein DFH09DRAFT_1036769 [Mycena vulgaris]|nr:hypothetical protein DFH09DRAFT_1036769 [Mycena vulgaris]
MQQERLPPLPPLLAEMGLACYKCFKEEDIRRSRCSGCHRVSYCSPGASSGIFLRHELDWELHKPMCKALRAMEKSSPIATALIFALPNEPTTDLNVLNNMTQAHISKISLFCKGSLQRPPTLFESTLVSGEPRCMVCTRTDQLIRMEAAKNGAANSRRLIPCPECNLTFCCSPAHWEVARALHHGPCEEALEGLSQCEMNSKIHAHIKFKAVMESVHGPLGRFNWSPRRVKSAWMSLSGLSWEAEFGDEMRKSVGGPTSMAPWILEASDNLSMALTVLYGLETLNDDDGWTRKHTLRVHIIGANSIEATCAVVFEEILHRLPQVKTLGALVLCGPDMPGGDLPQTIAPATCPECTQLGRKRIHEHVADKFEKPDLCIAFNSGASQVSTHTWLPTFKLLVERKIPTVFTSYNREEAEGEAALLRAAGAKLHPTLGPSKNPWGSIKVLPSPHKVYGFDADNGWLAGGFR